MPNKTEAKKDTERIDWIGKRLMFQFTVERDGCGTAYAASKSIWDNDSAARIRRTIDAAMEAEAHKGE